MQIERRVSARRESASERKQVSLSSAPQPMLALGLWRLDLVLLEDRPQLLLGIGVGLVLHFSQLLLGSLAHPLLAHPLVHHLFEQLVGAEENLGILRA